MGMGKTPADLSGNQGLLYRGSGCLLDRCHYRCAISTDPSTPLSAATVSIYWREHALAWGVREAGGWLVPSHKQKADW